MKKFSISILFVLYTVSASAQWQQVYTIPVWIYTFTATGNNIFLGASSSGLHSSTNNGINWSQGTLSSTVYSLAVSGGYMYAGQGGNGIFRSTNNGINWVQTPLNNRFIRTIAVNGATVIAGTSSANNEIYASTNNGSNWSIVSSITGEVHSLAISGSYIYAGGNPVGVFISTNNGANWQQSTLNSGIVRSIATNGSNIYAGTNSGLFISSNYGTNWIESSLSTQYIYSAVVSGANIYAATGTSGVYVSNNNGANWMQRNEGFGGLNVQNIFISGSYMYASAYSGSNHTVFRRSLSELTGILQTSQEIPLFFSLSQNYPNPFNPVTNIEFSVPKSAFVRLAVFDVSGREIEILVSDKLTPGSYNADWDASKYSSGIYFYTITSGSFRETKRMMLVK